MLSSISNKTNYVLCLNEEAKYLYMSSKQELITSKCHDFMVYKVLNGNTGIFLDYNDWLETIEIDVDTFLELHLNLCQKIGKIIRK